MRYTFEEWCEELRLTPLLFHPDSWLTVCPEVWKSTRRRKRADLLPLPPSSQDMPLLSRPGLRVPSKLPLAASSCGEGGFRASEA